MKLRILICSDANIIDAQTNRVSCINIIEEISSPQFPVLISQLSIVGLFCKEQNDSNKENCELLINLDGRELFKGSVVVNFQNGLIHRNLISFQGFIIPVPGDLKISILHNNQELGCWAIPVEQLKNEPSVTDLSQRK